MKITIDCTQRIFLIKYSDPTISSIFCNIDHFSKVIPEIGIDDFKIYHYWNRDMKRISKKDVNEMLKANQIQYKIK